MGGTAGSQRPSADPPGSGPAEPARRVACPIELLFETHADRLCRYVYGFVKSWETAQDLVQEVFLRLCAKHPRLAGIAEPEGYLYAAARNRALTWLKQQSIQDRWQVERRIEAPDFTAAAPEDPVQQLLLAETAAALSRAVNTLPDRQREVLLLQWKGMRYREIASALGISLKTVSAHLARANRHLRGTLAPLFR